MYKTNRLNCELNIEQCKQIFHPINFQIVDIKLYLEHILTKNYTNCTANKPHRVFETELS